MVSDKGTRRERNFARTVDELGGAVMRSPASGSATKREQPDHLFSFGDRLIVGEFKTSGGDVIYIGKGEVADLKWFGRMVGAEVYVITRWDGDTTYYFHRIEDLHDTGGKSYRMKRENARERSVFTLEDLAPQD